MDSPIVLSGGDLLGLLVATFLCSCMAGWLLGHAAGRKGSSRLRGEVRRLEGLSGHYKARTKVLEEDLEYERRTVQTIKDLLT